MMPMFSVASAEMESAIYRGDIATTKIHADKILSAIPDLKKSKPHKNSKHADGFKILADKLGDDVRAEISLMEKGDFKEA